jgi:hypothetical protein
VNALLTVSEVVPGGDQAVFEPIPAIPIRAGTNQADWEVRFKNVEVKPGPRVLLRREGRKGWVRMDQEGGPANSPVGADSFRQDHVANRELGRCRIGFDHERGVTRTKKSVPPAAKETWHR